MKRFGLIGKSLDHSFSPEYFASKFKREHIDARYETLEVEKVGDLETIPFTDYDGLNVTIPYKSHIISLCDRIDKEAEKIGAVNTLKIEKTGEIIGHNTDFIGFRNSLVPLLTPADKKALILGTGGASKAVLYALENLGIEAVRVSRKPEPGQLHYDSLTPSLLKHYHVIVNTSPLGMYPETDGMPPVSAYALQPRHLVYDLIYNPEKTRLLSHAEKRECRIKNGREMLILQAEASFEIWNSRNDE